MNTVLIIDDEEKLRMLLSRIISLEGYKVLQAGTLKAGKKILDKDTVDVILCDVKLPDGNGVSFGSLQNAMQREGDGSVFKALWDVLQRNMQLGAYGEDYRGLPAVQRAPDTAEGPSIVDGTSNTITARWFVNRFIKYGRS